jgi:Na+-translocating ferredoxin:NAD+ oxidoreductase RnfD subunit
MTQAMTMTLHQQYHVRTSRTILRIQTGLHLTITPFLHVAVFFFVYQIHHKSVYLHIHNSHCCRYSIRLKRKMENKISSFVKLYTSLLRDSKTPGRLSILDSVELSLSTDSRKLLSFSRIF